MIRESPDHRATNRAAAVCWDGGDTVVDFLAGALEDRAHKVEKALVPIAGRGDETRWMMILNLESKHPHTRQHLVNSRPRFSPFFASIESRRPSLSSA